MELIDKAAVVVRLKERLKSLQKEYNELVKDEFWETARDVAPRINEIQKTISLISNFEGKEMDSVKEIKDYKQKYEEVLERAKVVNPGTEDYNIVTTIFPELKESKDEKMWKLLKKYAHSNISDIALNADHITRKELEDWLEKQGEKEKTPCDRCRKEQSSHSCQDITSLGRCYMEGEQKPTNKVKPKFKVGDWIINSEGMLRHIVDVGKTGYQTDNGWLTHDTYEREFHLWTIQDAIDGDVLCFNDDVFILKYYILFNKVTCHCCYNKYFMPNHAYLITKEDFSKIHPATKEQRDLLFSKMEEVGYEWDAKEKKLIKL